MTRLAKPYMVHDARQMAGELLNGKWLLARWEHLGPDEDLPTWTAKVHAVCTELGVDLMVVNLRPKSMTLLVNAALIPPTFDEVENTVRAIEHARFTEREIGDKLSVQLGRT